MIWIFLIISGILSPILFPWILQLIGKTIELFGIVLGYWLTIPVLIIVFRILYFGL